MHLLPGLVFSGSIPWIAPAESNIGFPKYSLVCLLPLLMKFNRNLLSFPAYHSSFLEEFVFVSPPKWVLGWENKKDQEAAGEIKHTWENKNGQAVVARSVSWFGLTLYYSCGYLFLHPCSQGSASHGVLVWFGTLEISLHPSDLDQTCHWTQNLGVFRCAGKIMDTKEENLTNNWLYILVYRGWWFVFHKILGLKISKT